VAISVFGPKENELFQINHSLTFLHEIIREAQSIYPGWIVRVYHDTTLSLINVQLMQHQYDNVDFCNMSGATSFPPRTWRFLPAGDSLVDVSK
jgi:hypothetical protein